MEDFFLLKVSIISCEKGANNEGDSHLICWDNICLPVNKGNPASNVVTTLLNVVRPREMIFFYGRQWKPSLLEKYLDWSRCLLSEAVLVDKLQ